MNRALLFAVAGGCIAAAALAYRAHRASPRAAIEVDAGDAPGESGHGSTDDPTGERAIVAASPTTAGGTLQASAQRAASATAGATRTTANDPRPALADPRATTAPAITERGSATPPVPERTAANDLSGTPAAREMLEKVLEQLKPLVVSCYQQELARSADSQGDVGLYFHVSVTPNVGAVVHSVELEAGALDPKFAECIQESVGAIAPFDAGGPEETVLYVPLTFHKR